MNIASNKFLGKTPSFSPLWKSFYQIQPEDLTLSNLKQLGEAFDASQEFPKTLNSIPIDPEVVISQASKDGKCARTVLYESTMCLGVRCPESNGKQIHSFFFENTDLALRLNDSLLDNDPAPHLE